MNFLDKMKNYFSNDKIEIEKQEEKEIDYYDIAKRKIYKKYKSKTTAKTYYSAFVCAIEKQRQVFCKGTIDTDQIIEYAKKLKNRNEVTKLKMSIKACLDSYSLEKKLDEIRESKPKKRRKPHPTFILDTTQRKINNLKNDKLRIAYRLMLITGLRVCEIASLRKEDMLFCKETKRKNSKTRCIVKVKEGKGCKDREVVGLHDKYVTEQLKTLVDNKKSHEKLFYGNNYMQKIAKKNEFHCHQLRRAFAHIAYYKENYTVEELQESLGHVQGTKTYLKYIKYPVSLNKTRWDI
jgi:integrase